MSLERTSGPEIINDAAGTIVTAPDRRVQRWPDLSDLGRSDEVTERQLAEPSGTSVLRGDVGPLGVVPRRSAERRFAAHCRWGRMAALRRVTVAALDAADARGGGGERRVSAGDPPYRGSGLR
jgi:hypothetical protein